MYVKPDSSYSVCLGDTVPSGTFKEVLGSHRSETPFMYKVDRKLFESCN